MRTEEEITDVIRILLEEIEDNKSYLWSRMETVDSLVGFERRLSLLHVSRAKIAALRWVLEEVQNDN